MRKLVILALLVSMLGVSAAQPAGLCHPYTPGGAALVVEKVNAAGMIVCKYQDAPDDWRRPGN